MTDHEKALRRRLGVCVLCGRRVARQMQSNPVAIALGVHGLCLARDDAESVLGDELREARDEIEIELPWPACGEAP